MSTSNERAKKARTDAGLSQSEVARRMQAAGWTNYYQITVSRTDEHKRKLSIDEGIALADVLGVPFAWLSTGASWPNDLYQSGVRDGIARARDALDNLK